MNGWLLKRTKTRSVAWHASHLLVRTHTVQGTLGEERTEGGRRGRANVCVPSVADLLTLCNLLVVFEVITIGSLVVPDNWKPRA